MNQQIDTIGKLQERWPEWDIFPYSPAEYTDTWAIHARPKNPKPIWVRSDTLKAACIALAEKLEAMEKGE